MLRGAEMDTPDLTSKTHMPLKTQTHEGVGVTRKRCKGITRSGAPCTAWAMEGGLCYFHANPDKARELGKRGGRAKSPMDTPGVSEYVARPLKTVDDVTKLLGDTINDLRSGTIDSRLANTVGFLATGMLKALQQ